MQIERLKLAEENNSSRVKLFESEYAIDLSDIKNTIHTAKEACHYQCIIIPLVISLLCNLFASFFCYTVGIPNQEYENITLREIKELEANFEDQNVEVEVKQEEAF